MMAAYETIGLFVVPDMSSLKNTALTMFIVGCIASFIAGSMMFFWSMFAENIAYKTRIEYFRRCLEKDAAFYDENVPTAMASKISKETTAVQRGLGEKVATTLQHMSTFLVGYAFAFTYGWRYTCWLVVAIPVMASVGALIGAVMSQGMFESMRAYT
jgi:ABC-type multidrug transport system fused ATPase/permease subunit